MLPKSRLLVHRSAGAVLAGVDQPHADRIVVDDAILFFGLGAEDLVAHAGVDREPRADLEVVLHEQPVLLGAQRVRLEQESARGAVDVARQQRREPRAAGVGHRVVGVVPAEVDRAARVGVGERRRVAIDQPVAELQLMPALEPDERVLDLPVELLGIDRQERRAAGDAGHVGDVDVRQAGRELGDVDAADPERLGGLGAEVGLEREGLGQGVADPELVDEAGDPARASSCRRAVRRQPRVLDAGDERPEVEPRRSFGRRREAAGGLALRRIELELAPVEPDEQRVADRRSCGRPGLRTRCRRRPG